MHEIILVVSIEDAAVLFVVRFSLKILTVPLHLLSTEANLDVRTTVHTYVYNRLRSIMNAFFLATIKTCYLWYFKSTTSDATSK